MTEGKRLATWSLRDSMSRGPITVRAGVGFSARDRLSRSGQWSPDALLRGFDRPSRPLDAASLPA